MTALSGELIKYISYKVTLIWADTAPRSAAVGPDYFEFLLGLLISHLPPTRNLERN